jgi:hypothetical protein
MNAEIGQLGDEAIGDGAALKQKDKIERVNALPIKETIREAWLVKAATPMLAWIKAAGGGPFPKYRVSVGWPLGDNDDGE